MEESRKHPRFAVDITVDLLTSAGTLTGRCLNVSRGGLCALLRRPLPLGTEVTARVALVFDTQTSSEPLEFASRVVWSTAIGDDYQIGVAFMPPRKDQLEFLDMFLRYIEEGRALERGAAEDPEPEDPFEK